MYNPSECHELDALTNQLLTASDTIPPITLIPQLISTLKYHEWRYYVLNEPSLNDQQYDYLFSLLKQTEANHPELIQADSPSQRVSPGVSGELGIVKHNLPMLSLDNSYNEQDLIEFDKRLQSSSDTEKLTYCVEPKYDGSSIALVYQNDLLIRAATRGDGMEGEEITVNAKTIKNLPQMVPFSKLGIYTAELRGEVLISHYEFQKLNDARRNSGEKPFQNPRNTASGSLRMKDPNEVAARNLDAVIYHLAYAVDVYGNDMLPKLSNSHFENINLLASLGFKTPEQEKALCDGIQQVIDFCNIWQDKRENFHYEMDGMVIKLNDLNLQRISGATSHHPRWAIAYKFPARKARTKLLEIDYQVGRTGVITPIARLQPVFLSGVTISNVSLHNEDFIKEKDIRVGDFVWVERSGEVIPYISGVDSTSRDEYSIPYNFIQSCPTCNTILQRVEGEAAWRCTNINCPSQIEEKVIYFASRDCMDIEGLGRDIILRFIKEGLIQNIADIYLLKAEVLENKEGWAKKSIEKLLASIEKSKTQPLWRLINGFGIRHVGMIMAKKLASQVNSLDEIRLLSTEQITAIEDFGPKAAESVFEYFQNESNWNLILQLKDLGVQTSKPVSVSQSQGFLNGTKFLFTGTLSTMKREKAEEWVETHGGSIVSGVSSKLDYLVCGEMQAQRSQRQKS